MLGVVSTRRPAACAKRLNIVAMDGIDAPRPIWTPNIQLISLFAV